ncbi:siderophore ABC transporter substrate-binding protein [Vibrio sp. LaRot3]|uniref:siderophore ABC transporter substrate-binding protein n=1 Tax=Vibrio sp. LaRot3 TaxID=2998829 RepID=UPI0022CE1213|nr:siderophore ABC transporter substrate-binding protein [Vibrio sp. LaRot3]MDA0148204.1 siderophore ABC transporter substrate-binding protein [Vibrio sp. LaRot3]
MKTIKGIFIAALVGFSATLTAKQITVEHPLGKTQLDTKPQRVIVLGMDTLDVLNKLDIEPVGVVKAPMPDYLNKYQAETYAAVGSLHEPNFEAIFTLKPDLIIASNRSSESLDELSKIAPTVVFMADAKDYWPSTQAAWRMIGKIFEREADIEKIISQTQADIELVNARAKSRDAHALMVMTNGGNVATFGAGSRYSAIFDIFGFKESVANDKNLSHGDLVSFEYIAQANPDYLLVMDRDKAIGRESGEASKTFYNALIKQTNAAKNNRIVHLNPQAWYISASGITATQIMIEDMKSALK